MMPYPPSVGYSHGLLSPLLTSSVCLPCVEFSTEGDTVKFGALHFPEVLGARGTVLGARDGKGREANCPGMELGQRTNTQSRDGLEE